MAIVRKPVFSSEEFIRKGAPGNFVVLDRLQDPGNIGTIIRTADAAGYSLVMAMKGTADVFSPKVVRAAARVFVPGACGLCGLGRGASAIYQGCRQEAHSDLS